MIDKKIIEFINEHHVLTLAVSNAEASYCANCFYAFADNENMLIFTSDLETKHIKYAIENKNVSGSIVLETKQIGKIQGVQFVGEIIELKDEILKQSNKLYLNKFPYAILMKTKLWGVKLNFIKFTDNRLGFGKKIIWEDK